MTSRTILSITNEPFRTIFLSTITSHIIFFKKLPSSLYFAFISGLKTIISGSVGLLLVLQKTSSRYTINGKSIPSLSVFIIILSHIVTSIGVVLSAMAGSHLGDFLINPLSHILQYHSYTVI